MAPGYVGSVGRSVNLAAGSPNTHPSTKNVVVLRQSAITSIVSTIQRSTVPCSSCLFYCLTQPPPGKPCSQSGAFLPPGTPPTPPPPKDNNDWSPFTSRASFELAEILYTTTSLSNNSIDTLLDLWSATLVPHNDTAPFTDHKHIHSTIDAIKLDSVPWRSYTARYNGIRPEDGPAPEWMDADYHLWYRDPRKVIHNILANPDLVDGIDYVPYNEFENDKRRYCDFMSGNWAWEQCVCIFLLLMLTRANPSPIRTSSLRTQIHMDCFSFPLSWEATKRLCPSRPVNRSTTPSTFQLGTCITVFGEPTGMHSF